MNVVNSKQKDSVRHQDNVTERRGGVGEREGERERGRGRERER